MRLKVNLQQINSGQLISYNYQYPISCFINYTLIKYGANYLNWLIKNGFDQNKNNLDYYTFSLLKIPEFESDVKSLKIISEEVNFSVGMLSDESFENSIMNIFRNKKLRIESNSYLAEFRINDIKKEEYLDFSGMVQFKTLSPIVIAQKVVFNGFESNYYMKPGDPDYSEQFKNVLIKKYTSYLKNSGRYNLSRDSDTPYQITHFKIKGPVKSRLISIERKGVVVNKIRGFQFTFEISGDKNLIKFAYETGFGSYCGWGMGCVERDNNFTQNFNSTIEVPFEHTFNYDSLYT